MSHTAHVRYVKFSGLQVFKPAAPFTLLCLLASNWTPSWLDIGLGTATFLTCMSQQTHAWSHMTPSKLPNVVKKLQVFLLLFPHPPLPPFRWVHAGFIFPISHHVHSIVTLHVPLSLADR